MKKFLKKIVLAVLKWKAQPLIASSATVIGVTGSMGKTTCKEAIVHILQEKYQVLASPEGFNTDIGILLTLLGEKESGFSSPWKWGQILLRVLGKKVIIPEIIVLEFGVDAPGNMDELLDIIRPDYTIVTQVAPVHLGPNQFKSVEEIAKEKIKLAHAAKKQTILNTDNKYIEQESKKVTVPIISYGQKKATNCNYTLKNLQQLATGISADITHKNETISCFVPFFGTYHFSVLVPALILGTLLHIELQQGAKKLRSFSPPAGRGRILAGRNNSILWDSSYNSAPAATTAALQTLYTLPAKRKLALLGNMNELGNDSHKFHQALGAKAAECADEIFFVGKEAVAFLEGVQEKKPCHIFASAQAAGDMLKNYLREEDILLIKGSQNGVFLERAVKKLLSHPADQKLLCRQEEVWGKK